MGKMYSVSWYGENAVKNQWSPKLKGCYRPKERTKTIKDMPPSVILLLVAYFKKRFRSSINWDPEQLPQDPGEHTCGSTNDYTPLHRKEGMMTCTPEIPSRYIHKPKSTPWSIAEGTHRSRNQGMIAANLVRISTTKRSQDHPWQQRNPRKNTWAVAFISEEVWPRIIEERWRTISLKGKDMNSPKRLS